jgi:hypothetical protein
MGWPSDEPRRLGAKMRRQCRSVDVGVEVAGTPKHDHPDREHEDQSKGCKHSRFSLTADSGKSFLSFYDMPGEPAMVIEPLSDAP